MKKIQSALISVFYKDGLENIIQQLNALGVTIYSTGGTQKFIEDLKVPCIPVETLTSYPSILGGRVKTLHPSVFGGILGRRDNDTDLQEMKSYNIPAIDLVIVDLYPFEETLKAVNSDGFKGNEQDKEKAVIEKIDIGGPSMIRAAAKNFSDLLVVAAKNDYQTLEDILVAQKGMSSLEQRKFFAARAFEVVAHYDVAIASYFNPAKPFYFQAQTNGQLPLRYGENPHQQAVFYGNLDNLFSQLNGKTLSYNNLVDVDAAILLINEFDMDETVFAIIKHTNVCGMAARDTIKKSWEAALAGDPESAFGGVLVCSKTIDKETAMAISEIFFEVLIAPSFELEALEILKSKKNRIILQQLQKPAGSDQYKSVLNGVLQQQADEGNFESWNEAGGRETTASEKEDLVFANLVCKHLKSNAIAIVKNKQLVGKGCGQTSRIDALRHAIEKAIQFNFDLGGAVLASDAFFPFDDCVKIAFDAGISAFIQPGGSIRDEDSLAFCRANNLAMVLTGMRHFRH